MHRWISFSKSINRKSLIMPMMNTITHMHSAHAHIWIKRMWESEGEWGVKVCFRWLVNEIKAFDSLQIGSYPNILMLTDKFWLVTISASSEQHTWALTFSSFRSIRTSHSDTMPLCCTWLWYCCCLSGCRRSFPNKWMSLDLDYCRAPQQNTCVSVAHISFKTRKITEKKTKQNETTTNLCAIFGNDFSFAAAVTVAIDVMVFGFCYFLFLLKITETTQNFTKYHKRNKTNDENTCVC